MAVIQDYLAANPYQPPKKQPVKKQTGKGGTLTSLISEGGALGGAATGAAIGSVVPGVGTVIGGLIGGGLGAFGGRLAENKVRDNRYGLVDAAKEGAVTGLLGGVGKGVKYSAAAGKAIGQGSKLEEALVQAAKAADAKKVGQGVTGKIQSAAADRSAKGFGNKVGVTQAGKIVKPGQVDELQGFINGRANNYGGIKPGAPLNQARDAETVLNNVGSALDSQLNIIDRPLVKPEVSQIKSGLQGRVKTDAGLSDTKIANNFASKISKAKSVRELEDIRKEAQDLAFKQNGANGDSSIARQAEHTRDTIDEFVTGLKSPDPKMQSHIDEYKLIKGDYRSAKQVADNTAKEANVKQNGLPTPLMSGGIANRGLGGNVLATGRNKVNGAIATGGASLTSGIPQAGAMATAGKGQLVDALLGSSGSNYGSNNAETSAINNDTTTMATSTDIPGQYQNEQDLSSTSQQELNPYSREALMSDIQRDPKNASKYIDTYKSLQEIFSAPVAGGQLNSTAAGVVADTTTGLNSLGSLSDALTKSGANNPGIGQLRSFNPFDTEAKSLQAQIATAKQIVGKALEGGVLRKEDEYKYAKILPTMGDTDAVAQFKIQQLQQLIGQRLYEYKANIKNGGSLEDALMSQQGAY
jgi:hypothetical protein